jgi:peptidase M42 family hydrolase
VIPVRADPAYLLERLRALLAIASPSGYTDAIVHSCCAELERLGVDYEITRRGAIRARLAGREAQPARAFSAHVDTLGAQVKLLKDNGRMELVPIGHWSARFAEGARCTVFAEQGGIRGSILPLKASGHTFGDEVDTQPVGWPHVELRPDVMAHSAADLERFGFAVGDIVAIDPCPEFLDNGFIVSRHLDDKAGVASMFAALDALRRAGDTPSVDTHFLITLTEEVGVGASAVLGHDIASLISIDNGTTAPGQASRETGVTIGMADMTGPFDWHLSHKVVKLCRENEIAHQRDVFRYYRSDSAAALVAGADVRTALIAFGVDASHGYERIHLDALTALADLVVAYTLSPVEIPRDAEDLGDIAGFTDQPQDVTETPKRRARRTPPSDD